ncbi:MAG TPA: phosphotransferase [Candidatus Binataceae bacterium]|nr:phosphotransferase [Candidatus Binataceae bacterium]
MSEPEAGLGIDAPVERPEWPLLPFEPPDRIRLRARDFTSHFFDRALEQSLDGKNVVRARFSRERLLGFSGRLLKFALELDDHRTIETIVKLAYKNTPYELFFYRDLAPAFRVRVPRLYGSGQNPSARQGGLVIVLEALPAGVPSVSIDESHMREALRLLARMHAQFWDDETLNKLRWLPDFARYDPQHFRKTFDAGLDALRNLQEKFSYFPRLLNGRSCDLLRRAAERFELAMRRLSALPQTLVNGDVNLNNFIFPRDGRGEAAIVDWQNMCRGPAILDLSYFFKMQRLRGPPDWLGRPFLRPPLMEWDELTRVYFDELEAQLGQAIDREAHLEGAFAAEAAYAMRLWIPAFGISLAMSRPGLVFGQPLGWFFKRLFKLEPVIDFFLGSAIRRTCDGFDRVFRDSGNASQNDPDGNPGGFARFRVGKFNF